MNGVVALFDSLGAVVARTLSNQVGEFILTAPRPGSYFLRGTGMGYRSTPSGRLRLSEGETVVANLFLQPEPIPFEPLRVTAERVRGFLEEQGFYERMERRRGFFLTPDQLKSRPPVTEIEVIQRAPFVYVDRRWDGSSLFMKQFGRDCVPELMVDGSQAMWIPGREGVVEDWVNFADIIAVEVFRGTGEIPPELTTFRTRGIGVNECGLIVIWTVWGDQRARGRRQ